MPARKRKKESEGMTRGLYFFGDRDEPSRPDDVHDQSPILGKGKPPAALEQLASTSSVYIVDRNDKKPEVKIERVAGETGVWRVDVEHTAIARGAMALPGKTAIREKPADILKKVDRRAEFTGYRPAWQDALPVPRVMPDRLHDPMRRINKGFTDPLYVFGADDRRVYRDRAWPWGLVGKVYNSEGYTGTGALIGNRLIATAGHMVPWNHVRQGSWWMRFVPAYYDGASLHGSGVQSYVSDCRGYDVSGDVTGYDWVVCRLYNPLGNMLGYFGYNGYSDSWNGGNYWTLLGYPGAVAGGQRPSWQGRISVVDTDGDSNGGLEIESYADMTPGNSGGPFFGWWNGDPRLVGVVSGQETEYHFPFSWDDINVVAGGSGFTNLMAWGRTNWP